MLKTLERENAGVLSTQVIQSAIDTSVLKRISFWNSLIVNAAKRAHCAIVWSEDMQSGQLIEGVRIENPISSR